jgi:hypothetical protein
MAEYIIPNLSHANDVALNSGTYIVLINADKQPPHLALLIDGQVFSLTVKGPKLDMPLELQLKLIKQKNIKAIFVKLNRSMQIHNNDLYYNVRKNIIGFEKASPGLVTCLSPIKDFCVQVFGVDTSNVNFIFDLLPVLYADKHVEACYHYNMNSLLINGNYHLYKYSMSDIYESMGGIAVL